MYIYIYIYYSYIISMFGYIHKVSFIYIVSGSKMVIFHSYVAVYQEG